MMFSFATAALTFWLCVVAVACLHRIWRATTNQLIDTNTRDRPAGDRQACNNYRRPELAAEGLIPILQRSLSRFLSLCQHAISTKLSQSYKLISKLFGRQTRLLVLRPPSTNPVTGIVDSCLRPNGNEMVGAGAPPKIVEKGETKAGKTGSRTCSSRRERPQLSDRKRIRQPNSTTGRSSADHSKKKKAQTPKGSPMKAAGSKQPKKPRPTVKPSLAVKSGV